VKPLARNNLIVEELAGECVVYDRDSKKAHSLNPTVTWIWRHCDGSTSVDDLALNFEREFGGSDSMDVILSGIQQLEANTFSCHSQPGDHDEPTCRSSLPALRWPRS